MKSASAERDRFPLPLSAARIALTVVGLGIFTSKGISGLAQAIRVPANRISLIVNGKHGITADTAARLGRYFGTSAQYWLNIQNRFDLDSLDKAVIERDVIPKQAA